ncbi:MAG: hotdog fold thioesterase [Phycisphaerae bacterium]|nr:hotdog fold thioesterase [Phycisphaerae bacterium]
MKPDPVKQDRLARLLGMEVLEVGPGRSKVRMEISERIYNAADMVHGGALFALADYAFALAANSGDDVGIAISATMHYIHPAKQGFLHAECREVSRNKRMGTYAATVTDDAGQTMTTFQGLAYYKTPPPDGQKKGGK